VQINNVPPGAVVSKFNKNNMRIKDQVGPIYDYGYSQKASSFGIAIFDFYEVIKYLEYEGSIWIPKIG
jgi:hypothetical protein